jgi:hypothetical protein
MFSWPAFFGAALAIWLLLRGPATETPIWLQKTCRTAMAFFLYSGFLYFLKWNTFWRMMPAIGFGNRNKAEGFLILLSTLVWLVATLRILLRGFPTPPARSATLERPDPQQKRMRRGLTLTDVMLFYYSLRGK